MQVAQEDAEKDGGRQSGAHKCSLHQHPEPRIHVVTRLCGMGGVAGKVSDHNESVKSDSI